MDERIRNIFSDTEDVWIIYNIENSDPYFSRFITDKISSIAVCIISKNDIYILVNELDEYNINISDCNIYICNKNKTIMNNILEILKNLNFPKNIYLNYSDSMDVSTDVIGYGLYRHLTEKISEFYISNRKKIFYKSAEKIIYNLVESKSDEDIKYMKLSAMRALQIIEEVFKNLEIGMTEKEVFKMCHKIFNKKPRWFDEYNIKDEDFSWNEEGCPIVLIGPNLKKGGHTLPSDQKLEKGHTVYLDFGVKIKAPNGRKYASDLQRMGYCLKDGEHDAPEDIRNIFETLKNAINRGIKLCTPNRYGYEIDEEVRGHILENGYPNYNHSTGHPVGEMAHDLGTGISPNGSKRSGLKLRKNGVYTIEPRIQVENGGSIEEMILVTESGGIPLCNIQKELYLI